MRPRTRGTARSCLPAIALLLSCAALPCARGEEQRAAAGPAPEFELVYTAPVETTLARGDLRSPIEVWPALIDGARRTLDIAQFYATHKEGESLGPILEHLGRAAARGVKVRFLVEQRMIRDSAETLDRLRRIPGLELRLIEWSKLDGAGIHHAKYMVADREIGYLGSHNFDWRSLQHVQELGLLIRAPQVVAAMESVFEHDWQAQAELAAGRAPVRQAERPAAPAGQRAYLVASPWARNPPGVGDSEGELVRLIGEAQEEICAQVLDYAPLSFGREGRRAYYAPIDVALRAAAVRGVRVRLTVSHWNADHPAIDHLKGLSLVPGISVRVATIPEARQGFIPYARVVHAKYMVVDGRTLWLGTSNWTGGYLDSSRNLEVVVRDPALARTARGLHELLWDSPYAAPLDVAREYPRPRRH